PDSQKRLISAPGGTPTNQGAVFLRGYIGGIYGGYLRRFPTFQNSHLTRTTSVPERIVSIFDERRELGDMFTVVLAPQ
ncbi:MAG: hypothetical protein J7K33_00530, partial [Candidatus Marinimicrobia bacterium]|nr:hypothetical protein [Candidatus Neomarinimicrobiota bacterium]